MREKKYIYINGRITSEDEARVSPSERGFLLGDGLFETIMAREGRPLFLEAHLKRLRSGLKALGFEADTLQVLFKDIEEEIISRLLNKNELAEKEARVRITISRGCAEGGLAPASDCKPTVIISAAPVDTKLIARKANLGIPAITIKGLRPAMPGVKSINFMPNIIGAGMAKKAGAGEAFFLAEDNKTLLEGTSSNIFILREGELLTPPAAREPGGPGALPGVVRQVVLEVAKERKIPAKEKWFTIDELLTAEEAFITNSISGVVPIVEVDSEPIAEGRPGKITRKMQEDYKKKTSCFLLEKRKFAKKTNGGIKLLH
ncbi:MAG: aminotransferase class IV [Thermodesulfobacteriota bacterium]